MDDELYLDAAATEPVSHEVLQAMMPFLTDAYANPASVHQPGKTAARALDAARHSFAADLGARADDVIFTSGGTEADNLAVKGIALARRETIERAITERAVTGQTMTDRTAAGSGTSDRAVTLPPRIIISAIEHPAVAQSADWMAKYFGFEVVRIPVDDRARVDLQALEERLSEADLPNTDDHDTADHDHTVRPMNRTALVSVMLANNEVGTVQPVAEIARIAHAHGVPVHVDAVQAAGQIPIRMHEWDLDALSVSGHKFGAPKGLGALLMRGRTPIEPILSGGGQERGLRSGTQNVAGAVALAIGLHESVARLTKQHDRLVASRNELITAITRAVPQAQLTGDPDDRLPGHASFIFPGVTGEALLVDLDARGIACSSGSACAIGRHEIPPTLLAMGVPEPVAKSALRLTFRRPLTPEEIRFTATAIQDSCRSLGLR
ncbi:cysteine desulfurase family protein [Bifidobacterium simiarum]|uniref:cysteine desulfurase family protein n=1 Tax=Bifidobacterium simiarum TaxID=2045441 RepID=UPI001BDCEC4C|nr:cysteine desulfurase family protein [Bifidobacterium simiarum]MBT1165596.1 cysteine desulfurase [Bifidobacterium simiarum]